MAPKSRLRIGYVSSDLRAHPIAFLMTELWERHDRNRFEVFAYSTGRPDESALRRRIERAFERFADVRDETAAATLARIQADAIDILIDLNGYTSASRLELFAARPAPLQMHWLGFLGTQGADWFDYIITDRFVTPPEMAPHFAERFLYVPGGYTPSDTQRPVDPAPASRAALGLPERAFVFCCFNSSHKIIPPVFDAWMRMLAAIEGSVLWLSPADALASANLRREAAARGVAPERLVFARRADLAVYLARLKAADLFVDTWPYNAGTTANDALYVGIAAADARRRDDGEPRRGKPASDHGNAGAHHLRSGGVRGAGDRAGEGARRACGVALEARDAAGEVAAVRHGRLHPRIRRCSCRGVGGASAQRELAVTARRCILTWCPHHAYVSCGW
jgi:predicted O-linked N-acetylglucosamine transferase (SPINDLY family)